LAAHAKFSPSKAQQLIACPGSYALQHGLPDERNDFSDNGTGAHYVGSICLVNGWDADRYVGNSFDVSDDGETTLYPGDRGKFKIDAVWAAHLQTYLDEVRRRSHGKILLVEQRVEFSEWVGVPEQFGTSDAIIIDVANGVLEIGDLKFGYGKVDAEGNEQMMTYAAAVMETFAESLPDIRIVRMFISQPRIDHLDEWECTVEDIQKHMARLRNAILEATVALRAYENDKPLVPGFFKAGEKQCKFCKAEGFCPTKRQWVAKTISDEFTALDTEQSVQQIIAGPPLRVSSPRLLGQLYGLLPQIESWVKSVRSETERLVMAGTEVIGPDGLRMKVVEGDKGDRKWKDKAVAEAALAGHLTPEVMYKPKEIITAPAAGKILDKKKTAAVWDTFKPLIGQAPGRPVVVLGSDKREEWHGEAKACEFDNLNDYPTN
jgi:hypothetical protein